MIYWKDVRNELEKHCPDDVQRGSFSQIITYLKGQGLSMKAIAELTKGKCGRTALFLKMKHLEMLKD